MTAEQVERLLTWVIFGVILGGRLGFVLFYQPGHYLANPGEILKVWEGGMSFHGGFLGVVVAVAVFCRREGIALLPTADLMAAATPPGLLLGRIANFINAELWGRPTSLPWGVAFPGEAAQTCEGILASAPATPRQLYEAVLEGLILGLALLWLVFRRGWLAFPGRIMGVFLAGYGAGALCGRIRPPARRAIRHPRQPAGSCLSVGRLWADHGPNPVAADDRCRAVV